MAAKKAKLQETPTPQTKAAELLSVREQIKQLQEKESDLVFELAGYADEGITDFGDVIASQRTNAAKLEGLDNKAMKVAQNELMNALDPIYVKKSLDIGKMYEALKTDMALVGHLSQKGLKITQGTSWVFKSK